MKARVMTEESSSVTTMDPSVPFGSGLDRLQPAEAHSDEMRMVFSRFPAAVAALCATIDGQPYGLVATSLSVGTSYAPPMTSFSVRNQSTTWPVLRSSPRIGISILAHGQHEVCRQISSRTGERFGGVNTIATEQGALFIDSAVTWLDCEVVAELPAGDHTVVIFEIHGASHDRAVAPLVFHDGSFPSLAVEPMQ